MLISGELCNFDMPWKLPNAVLDTRLPADLCEQQTMRNLCTFITDRRIPTRCTNAW
jgi:hypothetical protein